MVVNRNQQSKSQFINNTQQFNNSTSASLISERPARRHDVRRADHVSRT